MADISPCMTTRHGEIDCFHRHIHRHGKRRRRCADCGATWSVWKRRRGKKRHPRRLKRLQRTFVHGFTIRQQAFLSGQSYEKTKARHHQTLEGVCDRSWPSVRLRGSLILLLDGLWFCIEGERWVAYLLALRSVSGETIRFLRPFVCRENECSSGWERVISLIPASLQKRICALVSDGLRGLPQIAQSHGWVYQWCHFHLLGRMANVFGTRKKTLTWMRGRRRTEYCIRTLITTKSSQEVEALQNTLFLLSRRAGCPRKIRMIIREVLRHTDALRAYLDHPELRLPATSNVMESLNSRLRDLAGRSRGFRTGRSLEHWITAYVFFNSGGVCRPKIPQN